MWGWLMGRLLINNRTPLQWVVLLTPIVAWFSYYPKISLGGDATTNYELSWLIIYLAMVALVGAGVLIKHWRSALTNPLVIVGGLFTVWTILTILWTPNRPRGVMVAGLTTVLWLVLCVLIIYWRKIYDIRRQLLRLTIGTATVMAGLAIVQAIAGIWLTKPGDLGLCIGCVAGQFGFVRPNLFAIEPQFLGSLFLTPLLLVVWQLTQRITKLRLLQLMLIVVAIVLTLSRGAIVAAVVGLLVVAAVQLKSFSWHRWGLIGLVGVAGVAGALLIQGLSAQLSPSINETLGGAIAKSINHLSLGQIDFRQASLGNSVESVPKKPTTETTGKSTVPAFSGYVAESTDIRVNLSKIALGEWGQQSWWRKIIGTGVGSAGIVMAPHFGGYQKEIVQNEYAEVLLERGVIGLVLLAGIIVTLVAAFWRQAKSRWMLAILAAYLVQYCFYSGLPNSLHVYMILIALYGAAASQYLPGSLD